jgi:hypothetical protein
MVANHVYVHRIFQPIDQGGFMRGVIVGMRLQACGLPAPPVDKVIELSHHVADDPFMNDCWYLKNIEEKHK